MEQGGSLGKVKDNTEGGQLSIMEVHAMHVQTQDALKVKYVTEATTPIILQIRILVILKLLATVRALLRSKMVGTTYGEAHNQGVISCVPVQAVHLNLGASGRVCIAILHMSRVTMLGVLIMSTNAAMSIITNVIICLTVLRALEHTDALGVDILASRFLPCALVLV